VEKFRATPAGYLTVGKLSKKMGVTIRTLQHYDQMGLLCPSAASDGGRRLYSDADVVRLYQILSLKELGFSLPQIKAHLALLDTPAEVADALEQQAGALRKKIEKLSDTLQVVELLQAEVLQMQTVDFKKYADIIVNLQMKNKFYWQIKNFDEKTLTHFRRLFDHDTGAQMMQQFPQLMKRAAQLYTQNTPPDSAQGLAFAADFWSLLLAFTGGDLTLLPALMQAREFSGPDAEWQETQTAATAFIEPALDLYLKKIGVNPSEEESP